MKIAAPDFRSDIQFLEDTYQALLGRNVDEIGKGIYLDFLNQGHSRMEVVLAIVQDEEFINKIVGANFPLLSILEERPDRYRSIQDIHGRDIRVFQARASEDFDWLEQKIIENGYYERPGVWSFRLTDDKRLHAEIVALFEPRAVLDIGCANGAFMKCLKDLGVSSEGVDISRTALAKAFPEIRENIHLGDILDLDVPRSFDFILGLDVFEHLNPNKLGRTLAKIDRLLEDKGFLFCNIPALGPDDIFGTIFEVTFKEWDEEIAQNRLFSIVPADASGYPANGHLIGAGSVWWVKQFAQQGFRREIELEKALHEKYDAAMTRIHVARRSFFVFSKGGDPGRKETILQKLRSRALEIRG